MKNLMVRRSLVFIVLALMLVLAASPLALAQEISFDPDSIKLDKVVITLPVDLP